MTHQQEFMLFLASLPLVLAVGLFLGHAIVWRRLAGGMRDEQRPKLTVNGEECRVVTEAEYQWLRASGKLRDVA